jgi:hypothetical protein
MTHPVWQNLDVKDLAEVEEQALQNVFTMEKELAEAAKFVEFYEDAKPLFLELTFHAIN